MRTPRNPNRLRAVAFAAALALAGAAHAQLGSSTIKGQVSGAGASAGTPVVATNIANGNTWRTTVREDGSYVLAGLAPGSYEIRVMAGGGAKTETITVQVGETASLDLAVGGGQEVTVVGSTMRKDVKTSEVGTAVSRKMIESLPQATHNFLSSADLAPGVAFAVDGSGNTKVQAGAQNFDHVNVYIDGVGQKNNILRGGLTGQDSSRGNPFPQSAIAEYRVISQNYKAEYEQVSSAAITAVTRSGTNEFHGDAYLDRTGTNWRAMTPFEKEKEAAGVALPPSSKNEYGLALGGPILENKVHFFVAYDGKNINDSRQVVPQHLDQLPAGTGIVPSIASTRGSQVDHFREHLLFGKIDAQLNDDQKLSASVRIRRESDKVPEDKNLSAPGNDKNRKNDETHLDLVHEWTLGSFLSEARAGYEDAVWNPQTSSNTPMIKYKVSTGNLLSASQDVLFVGGSPDAQKRGQKGPYVSEDLTISALPGHVMKTGAKFKAMTYELSGTPRSVDVVETLIDTTTGLPYYQAGACTGSNPLSNGDTDQCKINRALAPASVNIKNNQIGLYFQDDWALTKQVELNLGMRWDYENNMLNNGYVTPADRVAALKAEDGRTIGGITAPVGQTYAQSLAKGGINIDDYIADGTRRKTYKGAFAPRIGASWDLTGDKGTVLFGGWGRAFDRTMANHALDEKQKNDQPNGEIWLIRNDFKMPYADQWSVGVRQGLGDWNTEVSFSSVKAKNQFVWFSGNRDPNGGYGTQSPVDPLWGGPNGFGSLILGDFVGETKTNALFLKAEKPYTRASGWSVNVAYTYSDAQTTSREWNNDIFDWTYGKPGQHGWNTSTLVDKHRVVAAGVVDLPWDLSFAMKATFASGQPRRIVSCAAGWDQCVAVEGDAPSFRQVDVGVTKEFSFGSQRFGLRADILNVFNTTNYGGFDDWGGGPGNPQNYLGGDNANLGKPNAIRGDPRTFRLAVNYRF